MIMDLVSLCWFLFWVCKSFSCDFIDLEEPSILRNSRTAALEPVWKLRRLWLCWGSENIILIPMLPWHLYLRFKKIKTKKVWTCSYNFLIFKANMVHLQADYCYCLIHNCPCFSVCLLPFKEYLFFHYKFMDYVGIDMVQWGKLDESCTMLTGIRWAEASMTK